ncbi:MAG: hypothetical protein M3R63_18570 [Actinomycetota bacterium]|nr:hypothetical protein [Actinomycetota bacterium]
MTDNARRDHAVVIVVDGRSIPGWVDYRIDISMIEPADAFSMSLPFDAAAWDLCRTDRRIRVAIDSVVVLDGFIDSRRFRASENSLQIAGRDKAGRLVQESAPSVSFEGLTIQPLIARLAEPWFTTVTMSNARNRRVMRGRGKKVKSSDRVYVDSKVGHRIEPGQMRWSAIQDLCDQAGYMCWSSGDGRELVVGQPDYNQEIQYRFHHVAPGSDRSSNVKDLDILESTADRYSKITVLGSGAGTPVGYGTSAASRVGEAKNNPDTPNGDGADFSAPKRLVLVDDAVKSIEAARIEAQREMDRRAMSANPIQVTASGHGQVVAGQAPTLFVPDTLAELVDEETETRGTYLVVACSYSSTRDGGEVTTLDLMPKGTRLSL